MAVFYATGAASDPADFVTKLGAFAALHGFAVNSVTGGVVFHADSIVVGMNAASNSVNLRGGTAYNGAAAWNAQTNAPAMTANMNCGVGPFVAYHFFVGDEDGRRYVHASLELTDGVYRHLAFGQLIKTGTYTGGIYVEAVNWDQTSDDINMPDSQNHIVICDAGSTRANMGHVWVDYDSKVNIFQHTYTIDSYSASRCFGTTRYDGFFNALFATEYMKWNLRPVLYPLEYLVGRTSNLFSPVGRIPHMRHVNLRNIAAEDEIDVGGESWKCFPVASRTDSWGDSSSVIHSSAYYGYAFRMP